MAQTYPLDRVIRQVSRGVAAEHPSQRLVIVDVEHKAAVSRPLHRWRDVHYYLLSNRSDPFNESRLEIPHIALADLDERLEVSASLLVSCPPENEARVAVALFDPGDPPDVVLEKHVARWLKERGQNDVGAFAREFFADPAAVQRSLTEELEHTTGLHVQVKLSLHPERTRDPVRVEVPHLAVLASGWDEELDLGIRADLEMDDEGRAVLHYGRLAELHVRVPDEIRRFIRQHVSLAEFPDLGGGPGKRALVAHLDQMLRSQGRRVGALVLQPRAPRVTPQEHSVLDELKIPCLVREYPEPVMIENKVHVRVVDLVKYRGMESPDLRTWLCETLDHLIPEILFEARYTDLLLRFHAWEEKIRAGVGAAADRIGCEISQFLTVPNLPQRVLVKPFVLRTEQAYKTRLHDVEASLEVVVTARIPCLEDIAPLLSTQPDIPAAMKEAIEAVIGERMHSLHPERFYMRFGPTESEMQEEEGQFVEAELVKLVKDRLTGCEFHAEVLGIVIKIVETDLIRSIHELQKATPSFVVRVESLDWEEVVFVGDLRVVKVHPDGWRRMRLLTGGIEQVTGKVTDHVDTLLHTIPANELLYRNDQERRSLAARVSHAVLHYAAEQFGLVVMVVNFRRRRTQIEEARLASLISAQQRQLTTHSEIDRYSGNAEVTDYASLCEAMDRLTARRTGLIGVEGDEAELAQVEKDIAALKGRLEGLRRLSAGPLHSRTIGRTVAAGAISALDGGEEDDEVDAPEDEP